MRETKTVTYKNEKDEFTLLFTQLAPSKSLVIMMYLGKILGGSAGNIIGSLGKNSLTDLAGLKDGDLDFEKVGDAIYGLFDRLEDQAFIDKLNLLFSSVSIEGQSLDVDHHMFQGEPMLIFKVAYKALGVNYQSFLDGNSGALGKLIQKIKGLKGTQDSPKEQM